MGKEKRSPLHLVVIAIEKGAFWLPSTRVANLTFKLDFSSQNALHTRSPF